MAGHNIIDTLMPDGFAGKRVMSAAIDYFCGLPARPGKPDHKSHQNDGKQQTDRDDDGQTVLKMNLVLDDEVILGKEEHHALSPNDNTDGALNWLRVEHAFAGIGSDYRRATAIQLMANGRSQVFAMRSHLPSCVSPTQERRHASFSSPVKHHARMADIKKRGAIPRGVAPLFG